MFRIDDSPGVRVRASRLADELRNDANARVVFRCTEADGRSRLLAKVLSELEDTVFAYVPDGLDQSERVILEIAHALGDDVAQRTDTVLREEPEEPNRALAVLDDALGTCRLVIDGWDRLGSTADDEIGSTLRNRGDSLRAWLTERGNLFAVGRGRAPHDGARRWWHPEDPPVVLVDGAEHSSDLWERFAPDARVYGLALGVMALGADEDDPAIESATDSGLRSRMVELLPDSVRELLLLLSVHERPLPEALLRQIDIATPDNVSLGRDLGLWREMSTGLLTDRGWSRWWRARQEVHTVDQRLGELFARCARPADPNAGRAGLALLEAHRHFVAAGDLDRAFSFARHGVALIVEAARARSINKQHMEAAHLYERVVEMAEQHRVPVGRRLHAYARHYLHFNRARADAESLKETERGYRLALDEWPENALFWSRLVRVLFYENRQAEALAELTQADQKVPAHPEKMVVLIARTVRGLLQRNRLLDAILVWGDYRPTSTQGEEVERWLVDRLSRGWMGRHLAFDPVEPLFFTRDVHVRIDRATANRWIAEIRDLDAASKGASPQEALATLVREVCERTRVLIRAYTADLAPEDRMHKQRLLGAIDVRASLLDADGADSVWVFGDLERDEEGQLWLCTGGSYDLAFEVPDAVAKHVTVDDLPHFALVKAERGAPKGPVERIEPGTHRPADELWEEWRRRLSDAG